MSSGNEARATRLFALSVLLAAVAVNLGTALVVRGHPGDVAYLTMRKLLYMWGIYPFWNGVSQTMFGNCPLIPLMAAACISLIRLRRRASELAIFWTLPLFSSVVACISWGSWRFRMPGDIGLIVLAAALPLATDGRRCSDDARSRARSAEGMSPVLRP
jgi:hypothetical protein